MTIQSMTGFGKGETEEGDFVVSVEIKSVNHRFKDIRFKMPNIFHCFELELKNKINEKFKRGSFEVHASYKRAEAANKFDMIDPYKVEDFLRIMTPIFEKKGFKMEAGPTNFLRQEFYKDHKDEVNEEFKNLLFSSTDMALTQLSESREQEGMKLLKVMFSHNDQFIKEFSVIEEGASEIQKNIEEKLRKKVEAFSTELKIEESRFLQEVVYYMEKGDIHEEINRVKAHLEKLKSLLDEGGEIGRQIDFFIQELNRETNTIGSKSASERISGSVIQMKVQLEKMREQGLNLE